MSKVWPENCYATHRPNRDGVARYEEKLKRGEYVKPIRIRKVNGKDVIIDGLHRAVAAMRLGKSLEAEILSREDPNLTDNEILRGDLYRVNSF